MMDDDASYDVDDVPSYVNGTGIIPSFGFVPNSNISLLPLIELGSLKPRAAWRAYILSFTGDFTLNLSVGCLSLWSSGSTAVEETLWLREERKVLEPSDRPLNKSVRVRDVGGVLEDESISMAIVLLLPGMPDRVKDWVWWPG